jgi:hypothetical protein
MRIDKALNSLNTKDKAVRVMAWDDLADAMNPEAIDPQQAHIERLKRELAIMKYVHSALIDALQAEQERSEREQKYIPTMVDRFLQWPLPKDFHPNCGVKFSQIHDDCWPVGINLFTADQAKAMIEYMMGKPK